jgi:hypothetical protein
MLPSLLQVFSSVNRGYYKFNNFISVDFNWSYLKLLGKTPKTLKLNFKKKGGGL